MIVAFPRDKVSVGLCDRAEPATIIFLPVVRVERGPVQKPRRESRVGLLIRLNESMRRKDDD